jgi:hypothetical protein
MAATVGTSSVGMFGKSHAGWGIASIIFDHDVIDGAPAARFTRKLVELIESGYGLDDFQTTNYNSVETAVAGTN